MDKLLGGGIIDHEVGGGKTLIMCCGAYEKKRLGLANKPMIIGLKANIHEIARTFCTAYPMAKVLYPGKEDFTPRKRERIFREIRNNDWDAVILSHEQFGMIPQSPEIQQEILQAEPGLCGGEPRSAQSTRQGRFPRHDERVSETQGQPGSQVAEGGARAGNTQGRRRGLPPHGYRPPLRGREPQIQEPDFHDPA